MKIISVCLILCWALFTNANNFSAIRIYSNLAEVIRTVDKLPLEFTNEEWRDIRSDSLWIFGKNVTVTSQTVSEKRKLMDGAKIYIRSPLSSEKNGIQLIKAVLVDEKRDLVKVEDPSIATNEPLYFTVRKEDMYRIDEPLEPKFTVNFTYTNPEKTQLFLSYLQSNIVWKTQYRLALYDDFSDLSAMASISNNGESPISVDQGELISGDINLEISNLQFDPPLRKPRLSEMKFFAFSDDSDIAATESVPPSVGQSHELAGLYVFPINKPFSVDVKSTYILSMFHPKTTIDRYGFISKSFSTQLTQGKAQRAYRLRSDRFLSEGSCMIREHDRIVGQTTIPNLAAKDKYEFAIGEDVDIVYKENVKLVSSKQFNETNSIIINPNVQQDSLRKSVEITLRTRFVYEIHLEIENFKNRPVKVEYEQNGFFAYQSIKMLQTNKHHFIQESSTIKSNMTIPSQKKQSFIYSLELLK
ncbi:unnamed protein product [Adineta ricciae]|uniref:DUF4139 domain-containing protein n=1 Tax=Adineta ricciae TaxID=249248 RepID=A0A815KNR2_ADIRI|nr:unnamed protein product [Adineta ricciae]